MPHTVSVKAYLAFLSVLLYLKTPRTRGLERVCSRRVGKALFLTARVTETVDLLYRARGVAVKGKSPEDGSFGIQCHKSAGYGKKRSFAVLKLTLKAERGDLLA